MINLLPPIKIICMCQILDPPFIVQKQQILTQMRTSLSPRSTNQLLPVFSALSTLGHQLCCPSIQQLSSSLSSIHTLIQSIHTQVIQKDISLLNSFQNIIHLLDSCSLISKVTKTNDKKLFEKAFAYFTESLTHLVKTMHQYPINFSYLEKKGLLEKRHLLILQQAEENSVESSILEDNSLSDIDNERLVQENQELLRKNEELELVLTTMQKEVVQTELRMMTLLNDQREKESGRVTESSKPMKSELDTARRQIQEMNREFTVQIRKYNQVFRSMEREIEYLRGSGREGENEIIEDLETEMIKLREERERDDMIIGELREHLSRYRSYYKNHSRVANGKYR